MGRDYVTLREEDHNGETVWVETSVGRARLKSAPARVTHIGNDYRIVGAAWGAPIDRVEVKVDDGPWMPAAIDETEKADFAWKMWSVDWPKPSAGEHTVTSRAVSMEGQVQPAMDDPLSPRSIPTGKARSGHASYQHSLGNFYGRIAAPNLAGGST